MTVAPEGFAKDAGTLRSIAALDTLRSSMDQAPWEPPPRMGPALPMLDDQGLLRFNNRWIAITDTQIPVVALIVRRHGRLVRNADLTAAYRSAGGCDSQGAIRVLVHRLRKRFAAVGLRLHVIRDRGVVLQ
jgi:hypothetical protein